MGLLLYIIVVMKWRKCRKSSGKRKPTGLNLDVYFRGGKEGGEQCATDLE